MQCEPLAKKQLQQQGNKSAIHRKMAGLTPQDSCIALGAGTSQALADWQLLRCWPTACRWSPTAHLFPTHNAWHQDMASVAAEEDHTVTPAQVGPPTRAPPTDRPTGGFLCIYICCRVTLSPTSTAHASCKQAASQGTAHQPHTHPLSGTQAHHQV
jgi:hypothetical protein